MGKQLMWSLALSTSGSMKGVGCGDYPLYLFYLTIGTDYEQVVNLQQLREVVLHRHIVVSEHALTQIPLASVV